MSSFDSQPEQFQRLTIDLYGQGKSLAFLCSDLFLKLIQDKARFVLVEDRKDRFILLCSDLALSDESIIKAYSYRFKIEVNFKVVKRLIEAFFYHFWTRVWHQGSKEKQLKPDHNGPFSERLIQQATNVIEAFVNFACIAPAYFKSLL